MTDNPCDELKKEIVYRVREYYGSMYNSRTSESPEDREMWRKEGADTLEAIDSFLDQLVECHCGINADETMWAVKGVHGFYRGTWGTAKEAREQHCEELGKPWSYCRDKGDRTVKVELREV